MAVHVNRYFYTYTLKRILLTPSFSMVLFKAVPLFAPNAHIWPDDELIRLEMCAVVTPDPALT